MVKKSNDTSEFTQVFNIYSGHDATIAPLLSTLGVFEDNPPPYSAAVIIELRRKHGKHFVTVNSILPT